MEECDDSNDANGDGCSAACVVETTAPECIDIMESVDATHYSTYVTEDGRVLIAGTLKTTEKEEGAWVGAFATDGTPLWSLDLGPGESGYAVAHSIKPRGADVVFIHHDVDKVLVTVDGGGNIVGTTTLVASQRIGSWLDVEGGMLLAGSDDGDAWLGWLGQGGALETLSTFDYLGFPDRLGSLRRHGEIIGALAVVGVADETDGDAGAPLIVSTLLLEYDEQGVEQRRTLLSSGGEHFSLNGYYLDVTADGTWIVGGNRLDTQTSGLDLAGWAAAVRDGDVAWTFESSGAVVPGKLGPSAAFYTGVAAKDVLLAGNVSTWAGVRPWAVRLDGATGGLEAEFVGPAPHASLYTGAGMAVDGRVWLVGRTIGEESVVQWLCSTSL